MDSEKSNSIKIEIPNELSGLFRRHHNIILADDSLTDIDVILGCLYLIENANKEAGVEYDQCKKLFISLGRKEDNFKANVYLSKKKSLLRVDGTKLLFLIGGLKRIEKLFGQTGKVHVYIVKSGENFSAIKLFEEFLKNEVRDSGVLLCDSHISHSTLFPFTILKGKIKDLKILSANVYDSVKFKDYMKKMQREIGIPIEVKINNKIHDRYIISGDKCWSIGSSIKDFGNKDTIIREINEVTNSMRELFKERWSEATPLS